MAARDADAAVAAGNLRVLFGRLRRRFRAASAVDDLPAPQASVLARLAKEGTSSASVLAGAERVRPQSMAATLAALREKGLISREPDPEDGRRQVVALTESGRRQAEGARAHREEWLVQAFRERYTPAERARITEALALLDRLVEP